MVCSRCNGTDSVETPVDATAHPYIDNSTEKGVNGSLKTLKVIPTCGNDGLGVFTECSLCGKKGEFEVVIPSDDIQSFFGKDSSEDGSSVEYHCVADEEKKDVRAVETDDIKKWITDRDATAFVKGIKHAECPTCGKEFTEATGFYNVPVPCLDTNIVGHWVYSSQVDSKDTDYEVYDLTISEKNGLYTVEGYMMTVDGSYKLTKAITVTNNGKAEGIAYTTADTEAESILAAKVTAYQTGYGLGDQTFKFAVTEALTGNVYIGTPVKTVDSVPTKDVYLIFDDASGGTNDMAVKLTKDDHSHSFVLETGVGSVLENGHYTSCSCGLKNLLEAHGTKCGTCGLDSEWYTVTVKYGTAGAENTLLEEFKLSEETFLPSRKDGEGSYTSFLGLKKNYTKFTVETGDVKDGVIKPSGSAVLIKLTVAN